MKVGVITFHWATNYGAVLQSYALVKHLNNLGYEAEDINYVPRRIKLRLRFFDLYLRRFNNIRRESKFKSFRKKFLKVSKKTYKNNNSLHKITNEYDAVITGSDQIWNESFLTTAEKKPTLSYFLDFVPENVIRMSYAASFGTNTLTQAHKTFALNELEQFDAISVREQNAVDMLKAQGINAVTVCDPTLLIDVGEYECIAQEAKDKSKVELFNFMLRQGRESTDKTLDYVLNEALKGKTNLGQGIMPVEDWVWKIKNSDFVVTDSFHCMVFALLYHKPFIAVNDKNCSMNARINTLAQRMGVTERVIDSFDAKRIDQLIENTAIDWEFVDNAKNEWACESTEFIKNSLNIKNT